MAEKQVKEQKLLNDELQTEVEKRESILKGLREQFNLEKELANLIRGKNDLNKKQLDIIDDVLDHSKSILDNQKTLTEETFTQVDLEKVERELIREGLQDRTQIIAKLKEKQNIQKETNRIINLQADAYKGIGNSIDGFIQNIPGIGGILSNILGTGTLGEDMASSFRTSLETKGGIGDGVSNGVVEGISSSVTTNAIKGKIGKGFSLGANTGLKLGLAGLGALVSVGFSQGFRSLNLRNTFKRIIFGSTFDAFKEAFGDINQATLSNITSVKRLGAAFGVTADNSVKLLQAQTEISGLTDKQAFALQRQIGATAALRGVVPNDVFSDLAANTELFATFSQDGGRNLAMAAIEAKKLGLSLDTIGKISETILDFQSSIESELEASLLIGRQLNLNRARELALANDFEGLQREIVKQVGSERELNKLNSIERKSLAKALGITVAELGKLAGGEVEVQSTDTQQNTSAIRNLTMVVAASAGIQGAQAGTSLIKSAAGTAIGTRILAAAPKTPQVVAVLAAITGISFLINKLIGSNETIAFNTKGNTGNNFPGFMGEIN